MEGKRYKEFDIFPLSMLAISERKYSSSEYEKLNPLFIENDINNEHSKILIVIYL